MLKGDVSGKLECMFDSARDELNKLLEKKDQQGISWVLGDSGKKYFTVPTLVKTLRNHFGFELTLRSKRVEDIENYVHVEMVYTLEIQLLKNILNYLVVLLVNQRT